jgi:hypothetical protein
LAKKLVVALVSVTGGIAILGGIVFAGMQVVNGAIAVQAGHSSSPAATTTPKAIQIGDKLYEDTAFTYRRELPDNGDYAYRMADGNWVYVNRFQVLPAGVMAEVQTQANAVPEPKGTSADDAIAGRKAAVDFTVNASFATGKSVLLVAQQLAAGADGFYRLAWTVSGKRGPQALAIAARTTTWHSRAEVESAVRAIVAADPDTDQYLIVVRQ